MLGFRIITILALCGLVTFAVAADGHGHSGEAHPLGAVTVGETTFSVVCHGEIHPGEEAVFVITLDDGPTPSTIRAWVGSKSGRGSMKSKLGSPSAAKSYDAHLAVPQPLADDAALWLECVDAAGARIRASIALEGEAHDGDEEAGHAEEGHEEHHDE